MTLLRTAGGPVAYGIDEAWDKLTPDQMKTAGRSFVIGYAGENTTGKNLTPDQVAAYHAAGIAVIFVYEFSTTAVHGGASAGSANARLTVSQARAAGYPEGCALAFAVDENTSPHPSIVDAYAKAFTSVSHANHYRSMDYGGLATVKRCADLKLTDLHWQTYAWSNGVWDDRAAIRQVQNGVVIAGKNVDLDVAMVPDFGAWMGDIMAGLTDAQLQELLRVAHNADQYGWSLHSELDAAPSVIVGVGAAPKPFPNVLKQTLRQLLDKVDAIQAAVTAPTPVTLTDAQIATLAAQVTASHPKLGAGDEPAIVEALKTFFGPAVSA